VRLLEQLTTPEPPQPATFRRNFIESTFGNLGNFELLVPQDALIRHYFRDNDDAQLRWHLLGDRVLSYAVPPNQLGSKPRSVTLIQSKFLGDGVHGNFEAIVRVAAPVVIDPDRLHFWFLLSNQGGWNGPLDIETDGEPIVGVTGEPAFIESTFGNLGNFELLVPQGQLIKHYFRDNDDPQLRWLLPGGRALSYADQPDSVPRSITMIQSNFLGDGVHGNLRQSFASDRRPVLPPITWTSGLWIAGAGNGMAPFPWPLTGNS
jgi:hypothetical protein